jgi:hypothetical protein
VPLSMMTAGWDKASMARAKRVAARLVSGGGSQGGAGSSRASGGRLLAATREGGLRSPSRRASQQHHHPTTHRHQRRGKSRRLRLQTKLREEGRWHSAVGPRWEDLGGTKSRQRRRGTARRASRAGRGAAQGREATIDGLREHVLIGEDHEGEAAREDSVHEPHRTARYSPLPVISTWRAGRRAGGDCGVRGGDGGGRIAAVAGGGVGRWG